MKNTDIIYDWIGTIIGISALSVVGFFGFKYYSGENPHHVAYTIDSTGTCKGRYSSVCLVLAKRVDNGVIERFKVYSEFLSGDKAYSECYIKNNNQECSKYLVTTVDNKFSKSYYEAVAEKHSKEK